METICYNCSDDSNYIDNFIPLLNSTDNYIMFRSCFSCKIMSVYFVPDKITNYTIISDTDYMYIMNVIHNYNIKIEYFNFIMNIMRNNNHNINNDDYAIMINILNEVIIIYNEYSSNSELSYPEYSAYKQYYDYTIHEYVEGSFSTVNTLNLIANA